MQLAELAAAGLQGCSGVFTADKERAASTVQAGGLLGTQELKRELLAWGSDVWLKNELEAK